MNMEDLIYAVVTEKEFDDAVISVLKGAEKKGWSVFGVYDMKERLAAKGFSHPGMKVIEMCSARHADRFLEKNRLALLCMPCRIGVFEDRGTVKIAAMKPSLLPEFFGGISREESREAEIEIIGIVDAAR